MQHLLTSRVCAPKLPSAMYFADRVAVCQQVEPPLLGRAEVPLRTLAVCHPRAGLRCMDECTNLCD